MSYTITKSESSTASDSLPTELVALKKRILGQPSDVRSELEPLLDEVMEHTVFRNRVMLIARDALERLRVDMAALQFELDVTRRERDRKAL